jgi:hypothetical protein
MLILVSVKSILASQSTTVENTHDRLFCLQRISRPAKIHEHPTHHRRPVQHHKAFIDGHLEDTGGLLQLSNCPKLLRFNELANDKFFCTESAAQQEVTFINPDASAMGAYQNQ